MSFTNYLEDENDKPYFTKNSLAYYYDKMEGFAKAVEGSAKALNLTKEEVEKRITLYIEQNKNELDQRFTQNKNELDKRLAQWDGKLETFDSSVETLLTEWVDDGTLNNIIDSTLIDQKVAPLAAQLVEAGEEVEKVKTITTQTALYSKLKGAKRKLPFPIGFKWTDAPINIYKDINGAITTDFNVSDFRYKGAGQTYYVNHQTGHNSNNDGLTEDTPLKALYAAVQKPDVANIILADGHYPRLHGLAGFPVNKTVNIYAKNRGKVTISNSEDLTWTKTEGYTNVYQANRSSAGNVYDRTKVDANGDILALESAVSIAAVDAKPNSYFISGSTVYVRTVDSRPADITIRVMLTTPCMLINGDAPSVYVEGIHFEGGGEVIRSENLTNPANGGFFAKYCTFKYASLTNNYRTWGIGRVFSQECEVAHGRLDGFNYHVQNDVVPDAIEVDCIGRHNGLLEGDSNNGSTMHDGGRIIRVNGDYHHNKGPNVIDVNEGGISWCAGVLAHESVATPGTVSNADFKNGNVGASKMWLDSCVSYGSSYSLVTSGAGSASHTVAENILFLTEIQTDAGASVEIV